MFPDLRLLISATVATFFLAALGGLYASLRITQDQIAARTEGRTIVDDSPITRISSAWPLPEPGRAAAMRELERMIKNASAVAEERANAAARDDANNAAPGANVPVVAQDEQHALSNDAAAKDDATGSTGVADQPGSDAVHQRDHRAIRINPGDEDAIENANAGIGRALRPTIKKASPASKKKTAKILRRKIPSPPLFNFLDPLTSGYPLYLTVPVTN